MKRAIYIFSLLGCITFIQACESEKDSPYFQKSISLSKNIQAIAITSATNNGVVICGYTNSVMSSDEVLVMKLSETGNINWTKTFGGIGFDMGVDVIETGDGNYVITGRITRNGYPDILILKINSYGQLIWSKYLGETGSNESFSLFPNKSGGFYLTGISGDDMKIINFDILGDTIWAKSIGKFKGFEFARSIHLRSNGNLILSGTTNSFTSKYVPFVLELDNQGNELWTSIIDLSTNHHIYDMIVIENEGIYLTGRHIVPIIGNSQSVLIKTDMSGQLIWRKQVYSSISDGINDIHLSNDNSFILTGYITQDTLSTQHLIMKTTREGERVWTYIYGSRKEDYGYETKELSNGDLFSIGYGQDSKTNFYRINAIKLNEDGKIK